MLPEPWNNLIAYPDFEAGIINEKSLFWRVEASHSFFVLESRCVTGKVHQDNPEAVRGLRIRNYYHEPVVIRNGMWGSRIFLENKAWYAFGMRYRSRVRFYMGLYREGENTPVKFWVIEPSADIQSWQNIFSLENVPADNAHLCDPLFLKISIPDTCGGFVALGSLFLTKVSVPGNLKYPCSSVIKLEGDAFSPQDDVFSEVAVGIVTFNRRPFLKSLLIQLQSINYPEKKLAVFVVDNASTDGTSDMLAKKFPYVTVLKNRENLGGSGGFNRFFKHLASMDNPPEYGWLIDDDARIEKNTLLHLARILGQEDDIAIAGSVMMDLEKTSMVYEAGGDLFQDRFGWKANLIHADAGSLGHVRERFWEAGYAGAYSFLFRTPLIHQAGIWKNYFLHVDDSEWCLRVQRITGKKVVIALDSLIWHVLQGAKKPFTILRYYETRNFLDYFAGTKDRKALLKVMVQTLSMGGKQLVIKRNDLCDFHLKGIADFFQGRFGRKTLTRSADILPDIQSVLEAYKEKKGKYPNKIYLVREINAYMGDGTDHEGGIARAVRHISPQTRIIEASVEDKHTAVKIGDKFVSLKPSSIKFLIVIKMMKTICFPSRGIVVLPFWNESIIANNLAETTAVFEEGKYSVYHTRRIKSAVSLVKLVYNASLWTIRIIKGKIDSRNSVVEI